MKKEISVFILNDYDQILLQKRSGNKKNYPNMWALCTGHVEKNEDVQDAAIRELKEELGIDVSIKELHSFANGKFDIINENSSTYFFYIKCNLKEEKFIIQKEELSQVKWFDIIDVVNSQWRQVKGTKGFNYVANTPLSYSYLGFKVGKWDKKKGINVMDKNAKMNNKSLRQAIAYGMNVNQVNKRYTQGLTFRIPTLIPKAFGEFFDKDIKGYTYNIKKGNELLDKAGYKKKGTYRVQPNGKPLTIHLAAMSGSSTQEPIVQNYIQQWKKMGLNVKLTTGRLIEFNSFYDKVQNDDPSVDMFMGAWSLAGEPSQNDLYGEHASFNFTRFVTPENNKLIAEMDSKKAMNNEYRKNVLWKWQKYMNEEAYVVPISNSYSITAVNSKLTGYSVATDTNTDMWQRVAFTK